MQVIIAHVGQATTEADVVKLCGASASIQTVRLVASVAGQQRMLALVEFGDAGEAAQAIAALDGTEFAGRPIRVREAFPTSSATHTMPPRSAVQPPPSLHRAEVPRLDASAEPHALGMTAERAARAARAVGFAVLYVIGTLLLLVGLSCRLISDGLRATGERAIRACGWRHPLVHRRVGDAGGQDLTPNGGGRTDGRDGLDLPST